jgi:hypothetical protein
MTSNKSIMFNDEDNTYIFECPHCDNMVQVLRNELNCLVFRCGYLKKTMEQINPHLSKVECDILEGNGLIFGCGKPFQLVMNTSKPFVRVCEYI